MIIRIFAFLVIVVAVYAIFRGAQFLLKNEHNKGMKRLSYAISSLWIGIPLGVILSQAQFQMNEVGSEAWLAWFFLAVLPNVLFWLMIWVLKGFRDD